MLMYPPIFINTCVPIKAKKKRAKATFHVYLCPKESLLSDDSVNSHFDRREHSRWPKVYMVIVGSWEHLHTFLGFSDAKVNDAKCCLNLVLALS